jgi:hypothetical protein
VGLLGYSVFTFSSVPKIYFPFGFITDFLCFSLVPFQEFAHLPSFGITSLYRIHYIHSHVSPLYGFNHTVNSRKLLCWLTTHSRFLSRYPTSYFTFHSRIPHVLPNILFCLTYIPHVNITSPTNGLRHVSIVFTFWFSFALQHLKLSLSSIKWFYFFLTWFHTVKRSIGWLGIRIGLLVGSLGYSFFKLRCDSMMILPFVASYR